MKRRIWLSRSIVPAWGRWSGCEYWMHDCDRGSGSPPICLLYCHGLGEVAWLVYVLAFAYCHMIGQ